MALEYFNNLVKRRSIAFVISDFVTKPYEDALKIVKKKHDIVGVHLYDKLEKELPDIGLIQVFAILKPKPKMDRYFIYSLRKNYSAYFEKNGGKPEDFNNQCRIFEFKYRRQLHYCTFKMFKHRGKKR
ncbi:MAG: hypothetical protein R2772_02130 [Chitinophagales bacterium]